MQMYRTRRGKIEELFLGERVYNSSTDYTTKNDHECKFNANLENLLKGNDNEKYDTKRYGLS